MSSNDDIFSPEHYEAIGRLIVTCCRLDAIITDLISTFSNLHMLSTIALVHHQQFTSKCDSLLALVRHHARGDNKDHPLIDQLIQARAIYDYRSNLVHAFWHVTEDGVPRTMRLSARGHIKRSLSERPTSEIFAKAQEGVELCDELTGLLRYLRDQEEQRQNDP